MKFFNAVKGWGFIRPVWNDDNPGSDVFVHRSAIERRPGELRAYLLDGEPVEFELGQDKRGRACCVHVRRLDGAQPRQRPDMPVVGSRDRMAEAPGGLGSRRGPDQGAE